MLVGAHLHEACDDFSSVHPRFALDLFHLVDQPLKLALPFLEHRPGDQKYLEELANRIRQKIGAVEGELDYGFCHGDLLWRQCRLRWPKGHDV